MIAYTTDNMQTYFNAQDALNNANRQAEWAPITSESDPRIVLAERANNALTAMSDAEYEMAMEMKGR